MHSQVRRVALTTAVAALVLVVTPTGASAQADVTAFCQARLDLNAAAGAEDETGAQTALEALAASAPSDAQGPAETLRDLFERRGAAAFDTRKGGRAAVAIDDVVASGCGFPVLDVSAIDYEFLEVPQTVTAGPQVIRLTNDAPAEHHELVLLQVEPGITTSARKLLGLSDKKLNARAHVVAAGFAEPGDTSTIVASLAPGRYIYACFIDVGTTSGGGGDHSSGEHGGAAKPHWREGMVGELEVVGGA